MANSTSKENSKPQFLQAPQPHWMKNPSQYADEMYKFFMEIWRRVGEYKGNANSK
jgi:hypothetical protein